MAKGKGLVFLAVLVAALGYFVDAYDIMLFSIVRTQSLNGIGITDPQAVTDLGVMLLNWQSGGLLLGGIFWGILGDKKGRLSVLFGSILLYSIANIANGFVQTVEAYRWLRFLAGIGLSGELGAGITLVSEMMSKKNRGWGTTIIATTGVTGVVVASLVGQKFDWRTAYFVGGGMGLVLLFLRLGLLESNLYRGMLAQHHIARGDFLSFFRSWKRFWFYASFVLVALPVWYIVGVLLTFCPEIGKSMGLAEPPVTGKAIFFAYLGLTTGDMVSGTLSQLLKNRKKIILAFHLLNCLFIVAYLTLGGISLTVFYAICLGLGFSAGYWAVGVTAVAEQFGTNVRSTVTTTIPNFVRGMSIPLTMVFHFLSPWLGTLSSAAWVGAVVMVIAILCLRNLKESYGMDLNYLES